MKTTTETQPVVVITGASSGIGRGTALRFAEDGATVVLAARRADELAGLAGECEARGGRARAVPTDVSDSMAVEMLAQAAISRFGRIDVWVNNAGVAAIGRFDEVPLEDHLQVIRTDLMGPIAGTYVALRQFRRQGRGIVISVSSVLGMMPAPYWASYVAAKHGIAGLNGALRQELAESDAGEIHVCTVFPASMQTPFFEHAANYTGHQAMPIPPVYDPNEVVEAIVKLAAEPKAEVTVGGAGKVMAATHAVASGITERALGKGTDLVQKQAPPAGPTAGNLYEPVEAGTSVHGEGQ
jgi:short-subunit dehydrogenase